MPNDTELRDGAVAPKAQAAPPVEEDPRKAIAQSLFQKKVARRAAQRREAGVEATAEKGVAGANQPLPHLDRIQKSFGKHDVGGVRAAVGGPAAEANQAMGSVGYAT